MPRLTANTPIRAWSRGPLLLVLCGVTAVSLIGRTTAGLAAPRGSPTMIVATAKSRARHCAQYTPSALRALEHGTQRLVLVVHAFSPPEPPDGTLVVWLTGDGKAPAREVARVAIHPVRAFARGDGKDQRFALSLAGQPGLPAPGTPLCLEVGFDTAAHSLRGGRAETEIVLEDPAQG